MNPLDMRRVRSGLGDESPSSAANPPVPARGRESWWANCSSRSALVLHRTDDTHSRVVY